MFSSKDNFKDIVRGFYASKQIVQFAGGLQHEADVACIHSNGLGDTAVITHIPKNAQEAGREMGIFTNSRHFPVFVKNNRYIKNVNMNNKSVISVETVAQFNWGAGHTIQRMQKGLGIKVDDRPRGYLNQREGRSIKKRIALHLETGPSAWGNKRHKAPRQIYPENIKIIENLPDLYPEYEFVEIGGKRNTNSDKILDFTGTSIQDSMDMLSSCEFFIGTNSGFMNVAACMDIKSIVIVNVPDVHQLYLPHLVYCGLGDMEWLYPQNVHLHQDGENELVPRFSLNNLQKALAGDVYPFWEEDNLYLVREWDNKMGCGTRW